MKRRIRRGQMYYVKYAPITGSEQRAGRPGIIVSNEMANTHSDVVVVVYLTTQDKRDLPTHVEIASHGTRSTALCEQPVSVAVNRLGDYIGNVSSEELKKINEALKVSLELNDSNTYPDYMRILAERDVYKDLYSQLLKQLTPVREE